VWIPRGAGRFRGGFAAGCLLMPDADLEEILAYANAVAALNCRALGARGGLPTSDEVSQLLCARRSSPRSPVPSPQSQV
jgi:sugar/nucleoside kinase (ribokinase family)